MSRSIERDSTAISTKKQRTKKSGYTLKKVLSLTPLVLVGGYFSKKIFESLYTTFSAYSGGKAVDKDGIMSAMSSNFRE